MAENDQNGSASTGNQVAPEFAAPQISLPKGGGAIRGIDEKFAANPATGAGALTVPIATSPGRSGFGPQLALSYDSSAGNGPFGFGWSLSLPTITRRTDKGLPRYQDADESDTFILSGEEDLVPVLVRDRRGNWIEEPIPHRDGYAIKSYRPRTEGLFARIERWTGLEDGSTHWRSISRDNVLTVYGLDSASRVADPQDPGRVFSWVICRSYDDKGNAVIYDYAAEDGSGVDLNLPSERHRLRTANRYLKRVRYGNRVPVLLDTDRPGCRKSHLEPHDLNAVEWMFSVVFDYGEGHYREEKPEEAGRILARGAFEPQRHWLVRRDPFSSFRSTFEMRTYRLCRRVLMFHHFPEELGTENYLVRSTAFEYREKPTGSFIERVTQSGHKLQEDGRYLTRYLPPLDLAYTPSPLEDPNFAGFKLEDVDEESLSNLPSGIDSDKYRWLDLDGVGISGVLAEQAQAWFYKENLGHGRFGATETVKARPSVAQLSRGRQHLMDVAGDGNLDLVDFSANLPGFYERTMDSGWAGFRPFKSLPVLNWSDPNLRFVDVTGDGVADVLITEDDAYTWHPSLLNEGYGTGVMVRVPLEEDHGPRVVFADGTQSIYLADMTGDGLSDILRIRNGEVCYWPNVGYGRFGPKITMDHAPWFDEPDLFEQRRIRLADTDGSGTSDILYLGRDGVEVFRNEVGNGWSTARRIDQLPAVDNIAAVEVTDFLGRGTACLLWSSPLPRDAGRQLRYIDLMGGRKPHLLERVSNNLGAETRIEYASSTEFYLADKAAGTPWVTRLPFPVHVVKRVQTYDSVSRNRFVTRYTYHHGFYDGLEREFRGFGRVDQLDTEDVSSLTATGEFPTGDSIDEMSSVPPVLTKTWFHTGVFIDSGRISRHLDHEYYREGADSGILLDDTILPGNLTPYETREACRALKGSMLRQEIYALDGTPLTGNPYTVAESNFTIRPLQPLGNNRYAVFFTHPRETINFHYERNPADPRISHTLTLAVDDYGNVLKSAAIGYARRAPAFEEQGHTLATLTENGYTNAILEDHAYRTPMPAEVKSFQITAPKLDGARVLSFGEVHSNAASAMEIPYDAQPAQGHTQKRRIERNRTLYRKNDLSALLPPGKVESLALPGENYKQAFTAGLLDVYRAKASRHELTAILAGPDARYRDLDGDGPFWISSGRVFYSPHVGDPAPRELAFARAHFFLPHRFEDPFANTTTVAYDEKYNLSLVFTRDPAGNESTAEPDYRVLQPREITDSNGNRAEARFDALGMLAGTALSGKVTGPVEGDSFDDFTTDLTPAQIKHYFDSTDPRALAVADLGTATTRIVYDLERVPACAGSIARVTHVSDLAPGQKTKVQLHFVYSDGFGREAQTKVQAEPGPLILNDPHSPIQDPRWVGTGAKIYNNKGKPIREYEPFFSPTPQFGIEKWGVSNTLFYDPIERIVATLHPNNTFEKVVIDPWKQITYDVNDTVTFNPKTDPDAGEFFRRLPDSDYLPTWYQQRINGAEGPAEREAALKAAKDAKTPTTAHFDSLGRTFLTVANNGKDANGQEQLYRTRTVLDIEGNQREVIDALGRIVMQYDYDMPGTRIRQTSMEAGERWMLNDVTGKAIRGWTSRNFAFRTEYDVSRRPLLYFVQGGDASGPILFERTVYGDSPDTGLTGAQRKQANLRGKIFQHFDGAGVVTNDLYDFKGNSLHTTRQFARDYKNPPDWSQNAALEDKTYSSTTAYDALNRVTLATAPDASIFRPAYNEANLLERVDLNLRGTQQDGQPAWTPFVTNLNYDAKGQRTIIHYGNGAGTAYAYDDKTFRLIHLKTTRAPGQNGLSAKIFKDPDILQDLRYTYDPAGNITRIEDQALRTVFNANQRVDPACDYTYDAIYRLIEATGRENISQSAFDFIPPHADYRDYPFVGAAQLNDLQALRNYTEHYEYDPAGNFLKMFHRAANGNWTQSYDYRESSLLEPSKMSNRLSQTVLEGAPVERYSYDPYGNITRMPHLPGMRWDFKNQLSATSRQVVNSVLPETTYYVYGAGGERARKVTDGPNGLRRNERLYIGGLEIYRTFEADGSVALERETLHVMDDKQRIALVETRTTGEGKTIASPVPALRYQLSNHLGSASLELDEAGALITYEEYSAYGNTTYQAGHSAADVQLKRYRYTGKERDEESGFAYHGARYYAPWLGRWTSCDPKGLSAGLNAYLYAAASPVCLADHDGMQPSPAHPGDTDIHQMSALERIELGMLGGSGPPSSSSSTAATPGSGKTTGGTSSSAWGWIKNAVSSAGTWLKNAASSIGTWLKNAASSAASWIRDAASSAGTWLKNAASAAGKWIEDAASSAWNWTRNAASTALDAAKSAVSLAGRAIANAASSAWNATKSAASSVWNATKNAASAVWNATKSAASSAWNATKSAASSAWNATKNAASAVWNATKSAAASTWSFLKSAGRVALDIAGKIWALPNTIVGLLIGFAFVIFGSAKVTIGHNAIAFNNLDFGNHRAVTIGNVIFNPTASLEDSVPTYAGGATEAVGKHEEGHTYQYEALGPFFFPAYLLAGGAFGVNSPFERAADLYGTTGSGWWPW